MRPMDATSIVLLCITVTFLNFLFCSILKSEKKDLFSKYYWIKFVLIIPPVGIIFIFFLIIRSLFRALFETIKDYFKK